jgi:hypothetical protein
MIWQLLVCSDSIATNGCGYKIVGECEEQNYQIAKILLRAQSYATHLPPMFYEPLL